MALTQTENRVYDTLKQQYWASMIPETTIVAFTKAIAAGRMTTNSDDADFMGRFIYMGTEDGRPMFKHMATGEYIE